VSTSPASQKQVDLITRLVGEKDLSGSNDASIAARTAVNAARSLRDQGTLTSRVASLTIDYLFAAPRKQSTTESAPEGMHVFDGRTYKVQVAKNGSGNRYAKVLVPVSQEKWAFEYAPGAIRHLSADTKMSSEQAAQFGALYGICCNCNRDLTDEVSIFHGYGETCAKNNGWAYDRKAARTAVPA